MHPKLYTSVKLTTNCGMNVYPERFQCFRSENHITHFANVTYVQRVCCCNKTGLVQEVSPDLNLLRDCVDHISSTSTRCVYDYASGHQKPP